MKKLMGVLAIASVLSFVLMGCTPPAEGDTAPAPETGKTDTPKTDATKADVTTKPTTTTG